MIENLLLSIYVTFFTALIYVLYQFYIAANKNFKLILFILFWGTLHSILAFSGFYENTSTVPPRLLLLVFPIIIIIISSIFSLKMKLWLSSLNLKALTYLHMGRIPVELTLFMLFTAGYVPELMTFEGRNFDIVIGLTAPLIAFIAFRNNKINNPLLWGWNILSMVLLGNIMVNAVLSTPTVLQQFAFEQPNIAIFSFPFLLLPGIIVPLVLISNIAAFVILKKQI